MCLPLTDAPCNTAHIGLANLGGVWICQGLCCQQSADTRLRLCCGSSAWLQQIRDALVLLVHEEVKPLRWLCADWQYASWDLFRQPLSERSVQQVIEKGHCGSGVQIQKTL